LFSQYKVIVLGDREFCSLDLGNWLKEKGVSFCLRLKRNPCIETEHLVWRRLDELGIVPGTSLYFQGKRVRKTQPATGFDGEHPDFASIQKYDMMYCFLGKPTLSFPKKYV